MGTISAPCPHCRHDKSMFRAVWAEQWPANSAVYHSYLQCIHCGKGVASLFGWNNHRASQQTPKDFSGDLATSFLTVETWPKAVPLAAPEYTPPPVAKRFVEGEDAFARKNWNSAVSMYRSALDIATKGMDGVPKLSFFKRLNWMYEQGRITQDMKDWADHVRVEGNDALHEPDEFEEVDAAALRFFREMFLRYVFELPGRVKTFREQAVS